MMTQAINFTISMNTCTFSCIVPPTTGNNMQCFHHFLADQPWAAGGERKCNLISNLTCMHDAERRTTDSSRHRSRAPVGPKLTASCGLRLSQQGGAAGLPQVRRLRQPNCHCALDRACRSIEITKFCGELRELRDFGWFIKVTPIINKLRLYCPRTPYIDAYIISVFSL